MKTKPENDGSCGKSGQDHPKDSDGPADFRVDFEPATIGRVGHVFNVPVQMIDADPCQVRKVVKPKALNRLARDILKRGVIHPLVVVRNGQSGRFRLIAGLRRFLAATMARHKQIQCILRSDLDRQDEIALQFAENRHREGLCAVELAFGIKRLYEEVVRSAGGGEWGAWSIVESMVGISRSYRTRIMAVFNLKAEAADLLEDSLTDSALHQPGHKHISLVLKLESEKDQVEVLWAVLEECLSAKQTEDLVREKLDLPVQQFVTFGFFDDDEYHAKLLAELARLDGKRPADGRQVHDDGEEMLAGATLSAPTSDSVLPTEGEHSDPDEGAKMLPAIASNNGCGP